MDPTSLPRPQWLRHCVLAFEEGVNQDIPSTLPRTMTTEDAVRKMMDERGRYLLSTKEREAALVRASQA